MIGNADNIPIGTNVLEVSKFEVNFLGRQQFLCYFTLRFFHCMETLLKTGTPVDS